MIKEAERLFTGGQGIVFSSFDGIKASEMDVFRKKLMKSGGRQFILKKRLGKIAMENVGLSELADVFEDNRNIGATLIKDDPAAIVKLLMEFAKANKNFNVTSGYLEGRVLNADKIREFAELPGREQLIAMVVRTMNAPITGFAGVLASVLRSLCYALNSLKEKKADTEGS